MGLPVKVKAVRYCPLCGTPGPEVRAQNGKPTHFVCGGCGADFEVNDFTKRVSKKGTAGGKRNPIPFEKATLAYERYNDHRTVAGKPVLSFGEWIEDRNYEIVGRIG